jgi:hypothetical protein
MATPSDQHDTLVLTHDTVVLRRPEDPGARSAEVGRSGWQPVGVPQPAPAWQSGGWGPIPLHPGTAWSQVPPFVPATATPVLVMRNNAAVIGATLGSVSLFLSMLPLIGIVAWVLAPLGLISSAIGLLVGMSRRVGRVGALWGLLTSGVALVVCMAWAALLLML